LSCVVDHILQEFNTLFLTRFRTYKISTPPQTKIPVKTTSRDWCLYVSFVHARLLGQSFLTVVVRMINCRHWLTGRPAHRTIPCTHNYDAFCFVLLKKGCQNPGPKRASYADIARNELAERHVRISHLKFRRLNNGKMSAVDLLGEGGKGLGQGKSCM
jgi:hypothetical protein